MVTMERLRELRLEKGLTQQQLANAVNVNQRTISQYERGINEPDIKTLKKLSAFFNVTVGQLVGTEDY